jgi:hypothetical protein
MIDTTQKYERKYTGFPLIEGIVFMCHWIIKNWTNIFLLAIFWDINFPLNILSIKSMVTTYNLYCLHGYKLSIYYTLIIHVHCGFNQKYMY